MIHHRRTGTRAARDGIGVVVLPMNAFVFAVIVLISFLTMGLAEDLEARSGAG
jgi:hypothetical protein